MAAEGFAEGVAEGFAGGVAEADPALVEQALRQGGVATERTGFGVMAYLADLGVALARAIDAIISALFDAAGGAVSAGFLAGSLAFLFALVLLLLGYLLLRWWLRRRRPPPAVELVPASRPPELPPGTDWAAEIESRLSRGEIHSALEALWWWLAGQLAADAAERSWTTRELVQRAGRRDLLRAVMPLDRLLYAASQPAASDVRGVFGALREALPGAALPREAGR